jgi:hypothetical protein
MGVAEYMRHPRNEPTMISDARGAAQNRREEMIERIKAKGAPSFSPYLLLRSGCRRRNLL